MTTTARIAATLLVLALAGAPPLAGAASADADAQSRIERQLHFDAYLGGYDLHADVDEGVARLTGTVGSETERELALAIARDTDGVEVARDGLDVAIESQRPGNDSGIAANVGDTAVTAKVKSRLGWSAGIDGAHIGVSVQRGWVTLDGEVAGEPQAALAQRIAATTRGVRGVTSNLETAATRDASAGGAAATPAADERGGASDAWLSATVARTIAFDGRFFDADVDVHAEDGVVTLDGEVDDEAQRRALIAAARDVRGVRDVEARIETR